jgi:hypothetical protein
MNHSDEQLRNAPLASPSEALDRRMQEVFESAASTQPSRRRESTWRWVGALAAATGIAAVFTVVATHHRPVPARSAATQVLCSIEAHGPMRQLLLDLPAGNRPPPHFSVSVSTQ